MGEEDKAPWILADPVGGRQQPERHRQLGRL